MSVAAPPAPSPGKSRWVCGWAQGVDSVREILSVRASPRLCQNPAKLPAEEAAAAAAARVPLRARPAPRCAPADSRAADPGPADAARRWIRAAHQQTTSGRGGKRERKKKKGGREEKGAGRREREVGCTTANRGALLMGGSSYAGRSKVSEFRPPLHKHSKLCLCPVPPPPSPFNLRKPYRQLTHSRQHPAYLFIQSGSGSGLLLICSLDSVSYGNTRAFTIRLYLHIAFSLDKQCIAFKQQQQKDRDQIKQCIDRHPAAEKARENGC